MAIKQLSAFIFLLFFLIDLEAQKRFDGLEVTANGHYLQLDGEPFFWLGDTGWELFHRLKLDEIERYLDNRKAKGFNIIQAVLLAEQDGLRVPNRYGEVPLIEMDPEKPNEKYFSFVDSVLALAAERNMMMALLPTWGDKVTARFGGFGPVIFDAKTALIYGKFLGKRFARYSNVVWVLGGDRPPKYEGDDDLEVYRSMAKGLREGSNRKALITFHPGGSVWKSSAMIHDEEWLDFNMIQSGHVQRDQQVWKDIRGDWQLQPVKPTLDGEPCYEDHPVNPWPAWDSANGYFRAYDVRKRLYRSVFSGGMGATYGHHSVWQFFQPGVRKINHADRYWYDALNRPGAFQAGFLRRLIESRPFVCRIPDQSIIQKGQSTKHSCYATSFRDANGRYLMVYLPVGREIVVNTGCIASNEVIAWWFNPTNAKAQMINIFYNVEQIVVSPPTTGEGNDWVLVVDDVHCGWKAPGK